MNDTTRLRSDDPAGVRQQYKTSDNLQVRIDTHRKYSQPKQDYVSFILDQVPWTGQERVIDVGCGAGVYVEGAINRAGEYIACDLSLGMLQSLTPPGLPRINLDAQQLPFASQTADVVLANHMLYHVPDQDAAVSEIKRILKPGGTLLAATNSARNMAEMTDLRVSIGQQFGLRADSPRIQPSLTFTLEEGDRLLKRHFSAVARFDQPAYLVFPNAQPVVDYLNSSRSYYESLIPEGIRWEEVEEMIRQAVNGRIAEAGEFRVNKLTGVFVCHKSA